jgi:hypothetical protein
MGQFRKTDRCRRVRRIEADRWPAKLWGVGSQPEGLRPTDWAKLKRTFGPHCNSDSSIRSTASRHQQPIVYTPNHCTAVREQSSGDCAGIPVKLKGQQCRSPTGLERKTTELRWQDACAPLPAHRANSVSQSTLIPRNLQLCKFIRAGSLYCAPQNEDRSRCRPPHDTHFLSHQVLPHSNAGLPCGLRWPFG